MDFSKDPEQIVSSLTGKEGLSEALGSVVGVNFVVNVSANRNDVMVQLLPQQEADEREYRDNQRSIDQKIEDRLSRIIGLSVHKEVRTQMAGVVWSFSLFSLADKIAQEL